MQHPNVLSSYDMHKHTSIHVPNFNEVWFKGQNVRIEDGKGIWGAFPSDDPIRPSPPTIATNEERIVCVAEQEFAGITLNMHWFNIFLALYKVEGCVCWIQKRLSFESLNRYDFKAPCTANAQLGAKEMDRRRFSWNINLLLNC